MKKIMLMILVVLCFASLISAQGILTNEARPSLGFVTGANTFGSAGIHSQRFDIRAGFTSASNDASARTQATSLFFQGDMKSSLKDGTYFIYGLYFAYASGQVLGVAIDSVTSYGIATGFQQEVGSNLLIDFVIFPVALSNTKSGSTSVNATAFLNGSNIAVSYLF